MQMTTVFGSRQSAVGKLSVAFEDERSSLRVPSEDRLPNTDYRLQNAYRIAALTRVPPVGSMPMHPAIPS